MGSSATAHIGYGIEIYEGDELPWGDDWIEDWWLKESGFVPTNNPFTEDGEWKSLPSAEREELFRKYFEEQRVWKNEHPCPVTTFICGTYEACGTVVCVAGSLIERDWESSLVFHPEKLPQFTETALAEYQAFCKKYGIEGTPEWRLGASMS